MKTKLIYLLIVIALFSCNTDPTISKISLAGGEEYTFENPYKSNGGDFVWDFGDGNFSNKKSPTHTYSTPGNFIVSLSKYRNGKIIKTTNLYLVNVDQLYKPRIKHIDSHSIDSTSWNYYMYYDYFYIDHYGTFTFEIEDNDLRDNYTYEVKMDGLNLIPLDNNNVPYTFTSPTFVSSGYYNLEFKMFDDNLVSDTFDTTIFVGGNETTLNLQVPDVYSTQAGVVSERHVFVYEKKDINSFSTQNDRDDIINYLGPANGALVNANGEINDWETTSFSWYNTFYGIKICNFNSINNNDIFQISIPSHDSTDDVDFNDLYIIIVIVGDQGIAFGETSLDVLPGTVTPTETVSLSFISY